MHRQWGRRIPLMLIGAFATQWLASGCGGGASLPPPPDAAATVDTAASDDVAAGDAPGMCTYHGQSHRVGDQFPSDDGCNACTCLSGGGVACTDKACLPADGGGADVAAGPDGPIACDFSAAYSYGYIGGNAAFAFRSQLAPGNKYTRTRTPQRGDGPTVSCSPPLPPCGAQDVITAYDIEVHDLAQPEVRAALAAPQPLLYGYDNRPVDGAVFEFRRADGRGFLVGAPCDGRPACRAIPPGLTQLMNRLGTLDEQQMRAPECQPLTGN
jgi:hypothetical protein